MDEILANNDIKDVNWLCSLNESELDLLVSLKSLVIQRAKVIGHEDLAVKFDLKILRALALIVMEHIKGNLKSLNHFPGLVDSTTAMDGCSLLQCKLGDLLSMEELETCIATNQKKKRSSKR